MGEKRQFLHKILFEGAKLIFKIFTLLLSQMIWEKLVKKSTLNCW